MICINWLNVMFFNVENNFEINIDLGVKVIIYVGILFGGVIIEIE